MFSLDHEHFINSEKDGAMYYSSQGNFHPGYAWDVNFSLKDGLVSDENRLAMWFKN